MTLYVYTTPDLLGRRAEALRWLSRVTGAMTGADQDPLWMAEAEAAELWASVIENGGMALDCEKLTGGLSQARGGPPPIGGAV